MIKRILLVLALGISFSPVVLANAPGVVVNAAEGNLGQEKMNQTSIASVHCDFNQDKNLPAAPAAKDKNVGSAAVAK